MSSFGALSRVAPCVRLRCATSRVQAQEFRRWGRGIATMQNVDKKLIEKQPLAGIRVLDMTRVLAGVSNSLAYEVEWTGSIVADKIVANLHPNSGRPWVCYIVLAL